MKQLIQEIQKFPQEKLSYEALGEFVRNIDFDKLDYTSDIPYECEPGDYGRNILCLDPFECVLIYWPPGIESAIHYHKGFYGYVAVLEGELDNVEYVFENEVLGEARAVRYMPGGIAEEPDLTIHKLANPSQEKGAVSLHFYYPALDTLEDLAIYDTENGSEGILSATAKAASWSDKPGHFKSLQENAFVFKNMAAYYPRRSHIIFPVIPKPKSDKIGEMISAYYCEQATTYDKLDKKVETRSSYIQTINEIVATRLSQLNSVDEVLQIACGTGRRALEIRKLTQSTYKIQGIDISANMCEIASEKDIHIINSGWVDVELPNEKQFCAAVWLYAFGHLSSTEVRKQALKKLNKHLKMNAPLLMDVFNLNNQNEWGPLALKAYREKSLNRFGYEAGDVFYKRTDGKEIAFLHYFSKEEITELLNEAGFALSKIWNVGYVRDAGQIKEKEEEGFFMIHAKKVAEV